MAAARGLNADRKLRLLFILDAFPDPQAGTEGQFWLLFNQLDRAQVDPFIVLLRPSPWLQSRVPQAGIRVLDVTKLKSVTSLRRILATVRWARRSGFDVAHIFFNDSALVFPPLLSLAGIRVIVSRRDLGFWYTPGILRLLRFNSRFVDAVVANAQAVKTVVSRSEGFDAGKVHVIYNGLRRNDADVKGDARSEYGIPADAPLLAVVANLRPLKRIGDVIRGLAQQTSAPLPHLLVIGEDRADDAGRSHRAELEALAASLGIAARVHFAGKIEDPMPLLAQSTICLLCSETEGLSNAIIEYMFAGRPVVCTNVGGNAELVQHQDNGLVVDVGDVGAIASALHRLLADRELAARMGASSRSKALSLFHPSAMLKAHMRLYEGLVRVNS
jgi:glycosyltransferase involved in cell wall biosynthesis